MLCPFCDFQGSIYKAKIDNIKIPVYVCDECEILGQEKNGKLEFSDDLGDFMKRHGLDYMKTKIEKLGYDWDKSILGREDLVFCPYCKHKGVIYRVFIGTLGIIAYFCDVCDRVWFNADDTKNDSEQTLLGFLKLKHLNYSTARLEDFELEWKKEEKKKT